MPTREASKGVSKRDLEVGKPRVVAIPPSDMQQARGIDLKVKDESPYKTRNG
jgi:hypothetical protein